MAEAPPLESGFLPVRRVKAVDVVQLCRYLAVFLSAGVPVLDALATVEEDASPRLKTVLGDVQVRLRQGESLSEAFGAHVRRFPPFFVSMLRAAEQTGQLATVLDQLATALDRDLEARRKVRAALTYPAVVLLLALVSVTVLIGFVLPRLVTFFDQYGGKNLSGSTRFLVGLGRFVVRFGVPLVVVVVAVLAVVVVASLSEAGRLLRDRVLLRVPPAATVVRYAAVERFSRILASMVAAGVPLPTALDLAADGAGNRVFANGVRGARRRVLEGEGLWEPLAGTGLFPRAAVQMLRVGEETGTLEDRLEEVSTFYARELERRLKRLTDLLEPAAVIVVGLVVGFVAYAFVSTIYGAFRGGTLT